LAYISYFFLGILKEDHLKLYEQVEKRKDPNVNIVWLSQDSSYKQISKSTLHQNYTNHPSSALHSNQKQNSIVVNFLCERDGKHSIGRLCQQLGYGLQNGQIKSSKEITIELIDKKLNENLNQLPDPEVAIYFGNVCSTYGLLPWQIRLTEFISIKNQNSLRLKHFLHVLFVYAKCEQRVGI
jgi:undecaprenyl pyrophosphate synthase